MTQYISKSALVAEINKLKNISLEYGYTTEQRVIVDVGKDLTLRRLLDYIDTLEVKEVDLEKKSFVKIDRKLLFEICDTILNHYGYSDINDCPENDSECFWDKWDEGFRKKVENVRKNS